nr:MAG TPA: glycoside hydrolase [Caudoviricetes sp.]
MTFSPPHIEFHWIDLVVFSSGIQCMADSE